MALGSPLTAASNEGKLVASVAGGGDKAAIFQTDPAGGKTGCRLLFTPASGFAGVWLTQDDINIACAQDCLVSPLAGGAGVRFESPEGLALVKQTAARKSPAGSAGGPDKMPSCVDQPALTARVQNPAFQIQLPGSLAL